METTCYVDPGPAETLLRKELNQLKKNGKKIFLKRENDSLFL